jgi:cell division protein FtsL
MTKLNIILFLALIAVSLGVVTSQHKARKLYFELEQLQQQTKQFDTEYGQLQLEQSTWAMHSKVEEFAAKKLKMQVPDEKRIQVISLDESQ